MSWEVTDYRKHGPDSGYATINIKITHRNLAWLDEQNTSRSTAVHIALNNLLTSELPLDFVDECCNEILAKKEALIKKEKKAKLEAEIKDLLVQMAALA